MFTSDSRATLQLLAHRLGELLNAPPQRIAFGAHASSATVTFGHHTFMVEAKDGSSAANILAGLKRLADTPPGARPLLAVPSMSGIGQHLCERAGVSWIDGAGRAHFAEPSRRVGIAC